jgi:acetoin utilization deacetylase AcuC-like enzyme
MEGGIGFINEVGEGDGVGKTINYPIPNGIYDELFLSFFDVLEPILTQFEPTLIIVACGFDMYFADPIGNCRLTTKAYYQFAHHLAALAEKVCQGKIAFILEGGYSIIGLPYCVQSLINGLLGKPYSRPKFENIDFKTPNLEDEVKQIKDGVVRILGVYWDLSSVNTKGPTKADESGGIVSRVNEGRDNKGEKNNNKKTMRENIKDKD